MRGGGGASFKPMGDTHTWHRERMRFYLVSYLIVLITENNIAIAHIFADGTLQKPTISKLVNWGGEALTLAKP